MTASERFGVWLSAGWLLVAAGVLLVPVSEPTRVVGLAEAGCRVAGAAAHAVELGSLRLLRPHVGCALRG